ncbi:MAG: UDP-N-acetylmuramoyl-tripeptide--D-alanyl-D-alanine ligase [Candidatus Nealsonbacteria bacterium]|nr:UDP-N-acetylmuramoyl-tripeptide--D-alanyl-D-alanine ligase [Candidatus Nealsonbacteria bacterium]
MTSLSIFLRLFAALWSIRTTKNILLYLYLWQLKEYHVGRFVDHFRTSKGKKVLLNNIVLAKIMCLVILAVYIFFDLTFNNFLFYISVIVAVIYALESASFLIGVWRNSFKRPVLTKKSSLLIFIGLASEIIFFFTTAAMSDSIYVLIFWMIFFDVWLPVVVSVIVLFVQPFTVLVRKSILKKAENKRKENKNLKVIGITGSYGKTSTKEFLAAILSSKYNVLKTREHQNSEIGIASCILAELKPEHEIFIVEMGAYNKGKIKEVCDMVRPEIGIITGANEQHLALFGSIANLISAEGGIELANSLPKNGTIIINSDTKLISEIKDKLPIDKEKIFVSSDIAENVFIEPEFISFRTKGVDFKINAAGGFNIVNALMAIAVASKLEMSSEEISKAARNIKLEQGSINIIENRNGIIFLDSSYSANPDGVIADLDYLNIYNGKKVVIMPSLIELGPAGKVVHQRIGKRISEVCDLAIITSKDGFNDIKAGAGDFKEVYLIENPENVVKKINEFCNKVDAVLFESRIPSEIISKLKL